MSSNALARWTAFLKQIEERHASLLLEAEAAALEALPTCNYDPLPIATAWTAVSHRLKELERRIGDTWSDKVEAAFDAEAYPVNLQMVELDRGRALAYTLENKRELGEAHFFTKIARELYAQCVATQKQHQCRQCGAPLEVPITYRLLDVRCRHCNALSQFEPGTLARNIVVFGAHPLATVAAEQEWLQLREAERAMNAVRPPIPLHLLKAYERAQIAYWRRYMSTKALLEPEVRDIPREIQGRLDFWYRMHAEHEPAWVAAGRPRDVIA